MTIPPANPTADLDSSAAAPASLAGDGPLIGLMNAIEASLLALAELPGVAWLMLGIGIGTPVWLWMKRRERRADAAGFDRAESLASQHVTLLTERLESRASEFERLEDELRRQLENALDTVAEESAARKAHESRETELRVRLEAGAESMAQREALLRENSADLKEQFAALARDVFDNQGKTMAQLSEAQLTAVLTPFKEQVGEFKRRVDEIHHVETRERATLLNEVQALQTASAAVNAEAANLTRALKGDKRAQGQWGEMVLERLLQSSGLTEGREFDTQYSVTEANGQIKRPDVVVHLPDDKDVVIDAKVSLTAFERMTHASDNKSRDQALKQHVHSLRNHIKELSERNYDDLESLRSLDFVLMFVPMEGALSYALEQDHALYDDALRLRVMLVSPSTLLLSLRIINNLWRNDKQNRNAQEIADRAGAIYDKVRLLAEDIEQIGKQVATLDRLFLSARGRLVDGRGNLVRQIEQVKALGARVKTQIPETLVGESDGRGTDTDSLVSDGVGETTF